MTPLCLSRCSKPFSGRSRGGAHAQRGAENSASPNVGVCRARPKPFEAAGRPRAAAPGSRAQARAPTDRRPPAIAAASDAACGRCWARLKCRPPRGKVPTRPRLHAPLGAKGLETRRITAADLRARTARPLFTPPSKSLDDRSNPPRAPAVRGPPEPPAFGSAGRMVSARCFALHPLTHHHTTAPPHTHQPTKQINALARCPPGCCGCRPLIIYAEHGSSSTAPSGRWSLGCRSLGMPPASPGWRASSSASTRAAAGAHKPSSSLARRGTRRV